MFEVRWRWNSTRSLAVLRQEGGKKVPPPIQRMRAGDLLAAVFPSQTACAENVRRRHRNPRPHPSSARPSTTASTRPWTSTPSSASSNASENGDPRPLAVDTVEPSPMAHEILSAKPYAFLDDAPLEERRAQAVMMRRTIDIESARDLGALDASAIALVREQAWPDPRDADELHDDLALLGFATEDRGRPLGRLAGGADRRAPGRQGHPRSVRRRVRTAALDRRRAPAPLRGRLPFPPRRRRRPNRPAGRGPPSASAPAGGSAARRSSSLSAAARRALAR